MSGPDPVCPDCGNQKVAKQLSGFVAHGTAVQPSSRRLGEIEPFPLHGPGISGYVLHPVNPVDHIVDSMPGALVVGVIVVVVSKAIAP